MTFSTAACFFARIITTNRIFSSSGLQASKHLRSSCWCTMQSTKVYQHWGGFISPDGQTWISFPSNILCYQNQNIWWVVKSILLFCCFHRLEKWNWRSQQNMSQSIQKFQSGLDQIWSIQIAWPIFTSSRNIHCLSVNEQKCLSYWEANPSIHNRSLTGKWNFHKNTNSMIFCCFGKLQC